MCHARNTSSRGRGCSPRAAENDARAREIISARRSRGVPATFAPSPRLRRRARHHRAHTIARRTSNDAKSTVRALKSRPKSTKSRETPAHEKFVTRRREEHKETKRYPGFLTSSDIGTYPAHAVLTEKFRWVSVIFRGCGRLMTPCDARPFSRAPRGVDDAKVTGTFDAVSRTVTLETPANSSKCTPLDLSRHRHRRLKRLKPDYRWDGRLERRPSIVRDVGAPRDRRVDGATRATGATQIGRRTARTRVARRLRGRATASPTRRLRDFRAPHTTARRARPRAARDRVDARCRPSRAPRRAPRRARARATRATRASPRGGGGGASRSSRSPRASSRARPSPFGARARGRGRGSSADAVRADARVAARTRRDEDEEGNARVVGARRRAGDDGGGAGAARGRGAADATTEDSRGAERGIAGRRRRGMG